MNYDEIIAQYGAQGQNPFLYRSEQLGRDLGYTGTAITQTGWGGSPSESTGQGTEAQYALTPEFEEFLRGYQYQPAVNDGRNAALDIFDKSGAMIHDDYRTGDHRGGMMKFMGAAIPALVAGGFGVGALGAAGIGPMAGASGAGGGAAGAGGALGLEGASFAMPGAEAGFGVSNVGALGAEAAPSWLSGLGAENLAAIEAFSAANPVTANGLMAGMPSFGGAAAGGALGGYAGGGIGPATGVDALSPLTQSGVNAAALGASGSLPGLSGGIPWGQIAKTAGGQLLSAGTQMYGANQAAGAMRDATNQANQLNAPAVAARNSALEQMQALLKDPSTITKQPGYQFGMDQGTKSLNSGAAARGQTYSGGQAKALTRYGQDYAGTKLDQSFNRLSQLASGGQSGTSQTVDNITSQGNANAMPWVIGSNAVADGINGLTAYGQRKNWWGG